MSPREAVAWLALGKWVMADMGLTIEAGDAEYAELVLERAVDRGDGPEAVRDLAGLLADFMLPPGRRGRVRLVLRSPPGARALAFAAAVLRAVSRIDVDPSKCS